MKNLLFILFLLPTLANAQVKPLFIEGTSSDLHLVHTTGPKESFYSVGRIYNVSPRVFAPYNNLVLEKGLAIGQQVKIPLNEINFTQDGTVGSDEVLIPLYHKVKPKETLYNISATNNKVPVSSLKKWNKLSGDAVPNGINMVVGYLRVKKDLSPLAGKAVKVDPVTIQPVTPGTVIVEQEREVENLPVVKKEAPVKTEPVVIKETPVKAETVPVKSMSTPVVKQKPGSRDFGGGVFKALFQKQATYNKEETGEAGAFKSTSGWEDGKYYCLHNTALPGTIIKITNPVNQRFVYAKVLDVIPDIKQNEGMIIRVSNAAADELGVLTDHFECTLNF